MKMIGARQAWHDAMHENRDSVMAVAAEVAQLQKRNDSKAGKVIIMLQNEMGVEVAKSYPVAKGGDGNSRSTRTGRRLSETRCAHMLTAGLVQHAISSLPRPMQNLGHFFYSPLANGHDLAVAHSLVLSSSDYGIPQGRADKGYWLVMAALQSHKCAMTRGSTFGPSEVCFFIEERLGCKMNRDNWTRDWAQIWEKVCRQIDRLDAKALAPVAAVVEHFNEEMSAS